MDARKIEQTVDQHMMALRVMSLAFAGTLAVYAFVGWLLIYSFEFGPVAELPFTVIAIIAGAALSSVLVSFPVRLSILAGANSDDPQVLVQRYLRANVVSFAMGEVPAIVGLALSVLTADITWVLALGGISFVAMAINWPRRDSIVDWLQMQRSSG